MTTTEGGTCTAQRMPAQMATLQQLCRMSTTTENGVLLSEQFEPHVTVTTQGLKTRPNLSLQCTTQFASLPSHAACAERQLRVRVQQLALEVPVVDITNSTQSQAASSLAARRAKPLCHTPDRLEAAQSRLQQAQSCSREG